MKEQIKNIVQGKPILPGSLEEHYNVCGKTPCRCKDKVNPRKHGPYYRLSYSLKGKNSSVSVKKEDASSIKQMTDNYRQLRSNSLELGLEMIELYRHEGLQGMLNKYEQLFSREINKQSGSKPKSRTLQETCSSRDNWKSKSLDRQSEIDKLRVKVRDLEKSRNSWKTKAMRRKTENNVLKQECENIKKN